MLSRVVALVSGGGSGLGTAVARRVVAGGGRVVVADLNKSAAQAVAEELGPNAVWAHADCTDEAHVSAALDLAEAQFDEPVSAAVSTAGTLHAAKTVSKKGQPHGIEPFERVLRVNVLGTFNVARLAGLPPAVLRDAAAKSLEMEHATARREPGPAGKES